jgi:FkbM family methyltransferase
MKPNACASKQPLRATLAVKKVLAYFAMHPIVGMLVGRLFRDDIPFHGMKIDVRGTGMPPANKAALAWGIYESAEYRFVRDHLLNDLPVIDLGSSIGAVSSVIASRLLSGQRLLCVEANPQLIPALTRNVKRHGSHLEAEVVHAAVCYDAEAVGFTVAVNNLVSTINSGSGDTTVEVPAVTLAALAARFPGEPFQLVADIEGAELELFSHDLAALSLCRLMIVELHDTRRSEKTYTPDFLEGMIVDAGFLITARYGKVVVCRRVM